MNLLTTVLAALVGAAAFEFMKVPAGALIGAMVAVAALNLSGTQVPDHPAGARVIAFAAIGWLIGQGFDPDTLSLIRSNLGVVAASVACLLVGGALVAVVLVRSGITDPVTAFLATSPGGLSQMAALSAAVGANAPLVSILHLARVVTVVLVSPWVARTLPPSP